MKVLSKSNSHKLNLITFLSSPLVPVLTPVSRQRCECCATQSVRGDVLLEDECQHLQWSGGGLCRSWWWWIVTMTLYILLKMSECRTRVTQTVIFYTTSSTSLYEGCIPYIKQKTIQSFGILFRTDIFPNGVRPPQNEFGIIIHYPQQLSKADIGIESFVFCESSNIILSKTVSLRARL